MRSPITQLIQDYQNLTPDQQKVFLDIVDPQPEPQPAKRTRKKRAAASTQQKRGLPETIATSTEAELKCGTCGNVRSHADHDRTYIKSHDFEPPKSVARAERKSR